MEKSATGQKETFIVQILNNQNSTWQGTITWTDQKGIQHFRSLLEMIKLIDNALESGSSDDKERFQSSYPLI